MYKGKIGTEKLAFTLQIMTDVMVLFSFSCRCFVELQNFMTSSQRIIGYTELEPEAALEMPNDSALVKAEWPTQGKLKFTDVTMRYRETLEPSVRELSFEVMPRMKVGIVGRTGAGKSSIIQALFRLSELESGQI